jgi:hypothetical protein
MSKTTKILVAIIVLTFFVCIECISFYSAITEERTKSYNNGFTQGQIEHAKMMANLYAQSATRPAVELSSRIRNGE